MRKFEEFLRLFYEYEKAKAGGRYLPNSAEKVETARLELISFVADQAQTPIETDKAQTPIETDKAQTPIETDKAQTPIEEASAEFIVVGQRGGTIGFCITEIINNSQAFVFPIGTKLIVKVAK